MALDLREPCVGRAVGDQFERGVNRHRIERIALERDGLVGFGRGQFAIVVGERKIGQQLVRFGQLRIELDGFRRILGSLAVEVLGGNGGEPDVGFGIRWVFLQALRERDRPPRNH